HIAEGAVHRPAEDLDDVGVVDGHRDDVVPVSEHVLRHKEGGGPGAGLRLDPEHRDPATLMQDSPDLRSIGHEVAAPAVHHSLPYRRLDRPGNAPGPRNERCGAASRLDDDHGYESAHPRGGSALDTRSVAAEGPSFPWPACFLQRAATGPRREEA